MAESFAKRLQKFFNIGVVKSDGGIEDRKNIIPKTTDDKNCHVKLNLPQNSRSSGIGIFLKLVTIPIP